MDQSAANDDAPLIDLALAGKSEAFGQLVLKYQDRLYNSVFHVVGHAEDARDIVQEALIQAMVHLDSFQRRSAFFTWLYRIAYNAAITHRRRKKSPQSLDRLHETAHMESVDCQDGPAETLQRREQCRRVRQAIAQLGAEHRAVLVLREIDGCDYQTIAEILDLPPGTVRSRLHRARLELKNTLESSLHPEC